MKRTNLSLINRAICALALAGVVSLLIDTHASAQESERHQTSVSEFEASLLGQGSSSPPPRNPHSQLPGGATRQMVVQQKPEITIRVELKYDSTELADEYSRRELENLALAMNGPKLHPYSFKIVGHTDKRGKPSYNQALSERRANAILDQLVGKFNVSRERLKASGRGARELIAFGDTEADHQKNRRVVITRVD